MENKKTTLNDLLELLKELVQKNSIKNKKENG